MKPISTILVVNNEEKLIRRCLESIKPVSDEIIVIHDGKCLDDSLKIASEFTKKIFERKKYGCLEPHLVDALYMANNDWILRLDTDEYLSKDLIEHILQLNLENTSFTHFKAKWREWHGNIPTEQSSYSAKILLFNKSYSVSIGIPHRAVAVSGPSLILNGYLEHTPVHIDYGFKDLIFKKLKPFAQTEAKMRYSNPIKVYPGNFLNPFPKRIIIRNKYPLLTAPLFAFHTYLKSLLNVKKARSFFAFRRIFGFANAHLIGQFLLSYYMHQEKKRLKNINPRASLAIDVRQGELDKYYDEEYFEKGLSSGKSLYVNYHWMPELTIRMAYFMTKDLPIKEGAKILDLGCAKGYLVSSFRFLNFDAYGVDISDYVISKVEKDVIKYCKLIKDIGDIKKIFNTKFDWVIAKDIFEHIPEEQLSGTLKELALITRKMFVVVPLAQDDISGKFVCPDYNKKLTHFTAKTDKWWKEVFQKNNFSVEKTSFNFRFCKENWTSKWPKSNGFYILKSKLI